MLGEALIHGNLKLKNIFLTSSYFVIYAMNSNRGIQMVVIVVSYVCSKEGCHSVLIR